jgi:PIN domain nuclease of toxin-antitoxin system
VALWAFAGSPRIDPIRDVLLSKDNEIFVSVASWWELAIKIGLGKLDAEVPQLRQAAMDSGFEELPILGAHTEALVNLPPIHRDPFDRLLVAQAISEPMKLITADGKLEVYSALVWKIK